MSEAATAHASHEHPTNTGIPNKKLTMWAFLSSDCMFFGTLISTHLIYRRLSPEPESIPIKEMFDMPLGFFMTFALLLSSFFMAMAVSAMNRGNIQKCLFNVAMVIVLGAVFMGCMAYEYMHLLHEFNLTPSSSIFGSTFYVLTGMHGLHVILGIVWLLGWLLYGLSGRMTAANKTDLEVVGLYWHFVELVWVILFSVVYVLEFV